MSRIAARITAAPPQPHAVATGPATATTPAAAPATPPTAADLATTLGEALAQASLLAVRLAAPVTEQTASAPATVATPPAPVARPRRRKPRPGVARAPKKRRSVPAGDHRSVGARGVSLQCRFGNAAGERDYVLYVPAGHDPDGHVALPMLVMLHGCTQDPADFAAGTRMNALADRHGVLVAWPAQAPHDNGARCWNWFRGRDQRRDGGEPSILAGIVGDVAGNRAVDPRRVYVAGLSAGAAMAVILGRTHPDVFAAVGAHSGLPYAAARDVPSAFAAMHGAAFPGRDAAGEPRAQGDARTMPTIVFHGDADDTVHPRNGHAIVDDAVAETGLTAVRESGDAGGRSHTRDVFVDREGRTLVESWLVHGGGHAWSGGDRAGSHADPLGADASVEMLRFFLQHRHPRPA